MLGSVGFPEGKCVFLSSGSEAVEFGVQLARRLTDRPLLLSFSTSYLAAFGSAGTKRPTEWHLFDWARGSDGGSGPDMATIPFAQVGGSVFEPGGSSSESVRFPLTRTVEEIVQRVRADGGLIVVNEITTGMGRIGRWFGHHHYNLKPDIVAIGEGLGNGYPVSAVAMTRAVADRIEAGGFHYAQSHQNDQLGSVVVTEVIAVMREENWVEQGAATGKYFRDGLQTLARRHPAIKEARGRGMLLALEFSPNATFSAAKTAQALLTTVSWSPTARPAILFALIRR